MLAAWLLVAIAGSELALGGTKLQTGLGRVLAVWGATYVVSGYSLARHGDIGPVAFTIFWGGAFLSWFGVRSHIESSILLRLLYLLRRHSMTETQLLAEYGSHQSEAIRVEELVRGGLASRTSGRLSASPKGKAILRIVAMLR